MPDAQYHAVNLTRQGPVILVEMRRPETGNALSRELQQELVAAWEELESEDSLLVAVLHGAGGDFSVGHDVEELLSGGVGLDPAETQTLSDYSGPQPAEDPCFQWRACSHTPSPSR